MKTVFKFRALNKHELAVKELRKQSAYRDGRMVVQIVCWVIMLVGVANFFRAYYGMQEGWLIEGWIGVVIAGCMAMLVSALGSAFFDMADAKVRDLNKVSEVPVEPLPAQPARIKRQSVPLDLS